MGYPSLIFLYASFLQRAGLDGKGFNLRFVKCTAEIINDYQRELIEEVFGCPCISEYGAAETGVVSFECPSRNHHIMSDSVFTEFEISNPDFKGAPQKLIITNLYNYCFPIIRYEIDDLAYPQEGKCDCGSCLPLMSKVIGRVHDVIVGHNGKHFHSSVFAPLMKRLVKKSFPIKEFRFVQHEPGNIQMHLVRSTNFTIKHSKAVKRILWSAFKDSVTIDIVYCSELKRDPSGKFRYFISKLNCEDRELA
jgi:phenylacetate-CoA ligase